MVSARMRESPCNASAEPRQMVTHLELTTSASSADMSTGAFDVEGEICARTGVQGARTPIVIRVAAALSHRFMRWCSARPSNYHLPRFQLSVNAAAQNQVVALVGGGVAAAL